MQRNYGFVAVCILVVLPAAWLVWTTSWEGGAPGLALVAGALVTAGVLLRALLAAHRSGRLLPNRCAHCAGPVKRLGQGEMLDATGFTHDHRWSWRCGGCGRLV